MRRGQRHSSLEVIMSKSLPLTVRFSHLQNIAKTGLGPRVVGVWLFTQQGVHTLDMLTCIFTCECSCRVSAVGLGREIFPLSFSIKKSWRNYDMHVGCAASRQVWTAGFGERRRFSRKFPSQAALVTCCLAFRLRRLAESVCVCVEYLNRCKTSVV